MVQCLVEQTVTVEEQLSGSAAQFRLGFTLNEQVGDRYA
jgi:hypothetical protein